MKTTIRCVLTATLLSCTGLSLCASADTLILSHGYPPRHDVVARGIEPWMKCVKEQARPSLQFKYFPSGQIASAKDSLDAVTSGLAQVSTAPIGYVSDKFPLSGISMLPNMGASSLQSVIAFRSMLDNHSAIAKEFEKNRVVPVLINMLPPYQMMARTTPIDTLAKFKGKVFRSSGGTMSIAIGALQGAPAELSGGDMYVAMQRGTLDGLIMSLSSVKPYSMQELVGSISSNANFGTFPTILIMDRKAFDALGPEVQKTVIDCGKKVEYELAEYLDAKEQALKQEFSAGGIEVFNISTEHLREINDKLNEVSVNYIQRLEKRGFPAQRVYQEFQGMLKNVNQVSVVQ